MILLILSTNLKLRKYIGAEFAEGSQILTHMNAIGFHGFNFGLGRSAAAGYNGAGMSHPSAGGVPLNRK